MAEETEKEKAEKLAAAKKRFEQLKKKNQKKGKKNNAEKTDAEGSTAAVDDSAKDADQEADANAEAEADADVDTEPAKLDSIDDKPDEAIADGESTPTDLPSHDRKPSLSVLSKQRSESFRKGSQSDDTKTSSTLPVDASSEVQEIYRTQSAKIEDLEKQIEILRQVKDELTSSLVKAQDELEKARETSSQLAEFKSKAALADSRASEIEKLSSELASTQRQLTHAQQSAEKTRRASVASPSTDVKEQLATKTSAIESLELEMSNLRNQLAMVESDKDSNDLKIRSLEAKVTSAEAASAAAQSELETLKTTSASSNEKTSAAAKAGGSADAELARKLTVLETELSTAKTAAETASSRAASLESKIEALTKLHRESTATTTLRDEEIVSLRAQLGKSDDKSRSKSKSKSKSDLSSSSKSAEGTTTTTTNTSNGGEESTDSDDMDSGRRRVEERLNARIRDLEAETFELRRGVWRDKRTALQPDLNDGDDDDDNMMGDNDDGYEDVDLSTAIGSVARRRSSALAAREKAGKTSSFSDVLQSGISAFTGKSPRRQSGAGFGGGIGPATGGSSHVARKESLGLLDEDEFDVDAFRLAQEEEGKRRIERIKDIKRGLGQWKGWRMDLVDLRAAGLGSGIHVGPIFSV